MSSVITDRALPEVSGEPNPGIVQHLYEGSRCQAAATMALSKAQNEAREICAVPGTEAVR